MQPRKKKTKKQLQDLLLQGVKEQGLSPEEIVRLSGLLTEPIKQTHLTNFFSEMETDMLINSEMLQNYIKRELRSDDYDLPTVISEMCKMKEEIQGLLTTINNLRNINDLNNQIIMIGIPGNPQSIKGEIKEVNQNKNGIGFSLLDSNNLNHKVTLFSNPEYIEAAEMASENQTTFEHWLSGVQFKRNGNAINIQNKFVRINQKGSKSLIYFMPEGIYSIEVRYSSNGKLESVAFISESGTRKQLRAEPNSNDPTEIQLVCDELQKPIPYRSFRRSLCIVDFQKFRIEYKNVEESEKLLRLLKGKQGQQNQNELNVIGVVEDINALKSEAIEQFKQTYMHRILVELFDRLTLPITTEEFCRGQQIREIIADEDFLDIKHVLNTIKGKHSSLGKDFSVEQILRDILVETNYSLLVPKQEAVNTVRTLHLLTDSDKSLVQIQGKEIIGFYGATGAGKSTTVNYLMGVPLKAHTDKYGQTIIERDQKKYQNQRGDQPKIGHSIGTSETIYAQGHQFIKQSIQAELRPLTNNVVLCDNPGFSDTRGTQYQICTSMSIDMAVEKSNRLRAIVLVIPYNSFTTDRSNLVFKLIDLMEERFPDLLSTGTQTYKTFHILITKWKDQQQVDSFQSRLADYITEQLKNRKINSGDESMHPAIMNAKLRVLQVLQNMYAEGKIQFMYPTNRQQRQQLLASYLNSGDVPKQRYRKFMETGNLKQRLLKHLETSAHTWATLLIYPFTNLIPQRIKECQMRMEQLKNGSKERAQNIEDLIIQNRESPYTIQKYEQQLFSFKNSTKTPEGEFPSQTNLMEEDNEFIKSVEKIQADLKDKISENEEKLSKKKDQISQKQKVLAQKQDALARQIKSASDLTARIQKLKTGKYHKVIFERTPTLGDVMILNTRLTHKIINTALESFKQIDNQNQKQFLIGSSEEKIMYQPVIKKQYSILPDRNFDPNSYIEACKKKKTFQQSNFEAKVDCRHAVLQKINSSPDGKQMVLRVFFYYKQTTKQRELPYLKLTHQIPNEIKNEVEIKNKESEVLVETQETERLAKQVEETKEVIANYNQQRLIFESMISESKKTLAENQEDLKSQIEVFYQKAIEREKQSIKKNTEKIAEFKKMNQKSEESAKNQELKYETHKMTYRRIAFLIKDQMSKNIPQSLVRIIKEATKNDSHNKESDRDYGSKKNQQQVFDKFIYHFESQRHIIDKSIEQVLRGQEFRRNGSHIPQVVMHKDIQKDVVAQIDNIPLNSGHPDGENGREEKKCCLLF